MRRLNPTRSSRTSQPLGKHSSFGRFEQTSHHLHRRTLAGSVWPHLAEDFAFGQREVQIFHGWYARYLFVRRRSSSTAPPRESEPQHTQGQSERNGEQSG